MILSVLVIFIILYIYIKYPHIFDFKQNTSGRYIRLERESGSEAINFANFIIKGNNQIINPIALNVNPGLALGDGIKPTANNADLTDIVLVETMSTGIPYIEYDLGTSKNISDIIIFNRKKYKERMNNTVLWILDNDRNIIFEKKIDNVQDIYHINTY